MPKMQRGSFAVVAGVSVFIFFSGLGDGTARPAGISPTHRHLHPGDLRGFWEAYTSDHERFYRLVFYPDGSAYVAIAMGPTPPVHTLLFRLDEVIVRDGKVELKGSEWPGRRAVFRLQGHGTVTPNIFAMHGTVKITGPSDGDEWFSEPVRLFRRSFVRDLRKLEDAAVDALKEVRRK